MELQNISRAFKTRQNVKFCSDGIALDVMDYLVKDREEVWYRLTLKRYSKTDKESR